MYEVWSELIKVWNSIEQFGETTFTAVVPKKIKDFLD
jgi:dynein heavy chain 1